MKTNEFFFKLGGTAWLLTVGLSALALIVGWLTNFHLKEEEWRSLWLLGGGGGLACMIIGGVIAIWEE